MLMIVKLVGFSIMSSPSERKEWNSIVWYDLHSPIFVSSKLNVVAEAKRMWGAIYSFMSCTYLPDELPPSFFMAIFFAILSEICIFVADEVGEEKNTWRYNKTRTSLVN